MFNFNKENLDKRIGKNIQRIRKEQGITQEELAEKIGAIKQTISKIERGTYSITFKSLLQICEFLNTSPNELLLIDTDWLEWKEENIRKTNNSINSLADEMSVVEDLWAKAELCREKNDEKGELFYLDSIIQIYTKGRNDHYRMFAEFIYRNRLNKLLDYTINELRSNKVNNLKIKDKN